jgi:hypothetical protein
MVCQTTSVVIGYTQHEIELTPKQRQFVDEYLRGVPALNYRR